MLMNERTDERDCMIEGLVSFVQSAGVWGCIFMLARTVREDTYPRTFYIGNGSTHCSREATST